MPRQKQYGYFAAPLIFTLPLDKENSPGTLTW